ncbi:MAG: hypothetical protein ACO2ZZ_13060 [Cyclobacteriaceae bacterium]
MKLLYSLFLIGLAGVVCAQPKKNKNPLIGSWELVKYVNHAANGTDWESYGEEIVYQKHISDAHFSWVRYDKSKDQLIGMGGGSYTIDNKGRYIEDIQFFYPPGSSELGQNIPFEMYLNMGKWLHTGYAKEMGFNAEGEVVVMDSTKIEEEWRAIPEGENNFDLIGTWELESYREKMGGSMFEYPEFIVYTKLITATHFMWIQYDSEGDQVYALGAGEYSYDGNEYIENLEVTYPQGLNVNGMSISFTPVVNVNKWVHKQKSVHAVGDSLFIDEIWVLKEAIVSE